MKKSPESGLSALSTVPSLTTGHVLSDDEAILASLGYEQSMTRKFGLWSMLSLAFSILGTWVALAASLSTGLYNGGTTSLVWGASLDPECGLISLTSRQTVIAGFCMYCLATSLGELLSVYPTNLGQAYFVLQLGEGKPHVRILSYITGWVNMAGWWTLIASFSLFTTSFYISIVQLFRPGFQTQPWQNFIIFEGTVWAAAVANVMMTRIEKLLPVFNSIMMISNLLVFGGILITLLACEGTNGTFQSGHFIFATWANLSGWPDGFAFLQGLLSATYGFTAFDSVIHMIEELPNPGKNGPKAMNLAVSTGALTGLMFLIVVFACATSMDSLLETEFDLPYVQVLYDTIGRDGAAVLMILLQINTVVSGVSITTAASRLTFGFARDHGLPFSNYFAQTSEYWRMPVRATFGQAGVVSLIGIFFFASNDVLTAVVSLSSITLVVACAIPVAYLLIVGRDHLPAGRKHNLGKAGYLYNAVGVGFAMLISVVFFFPSSPSPSPREMNWAIVAFGALVLLAVASWFLGARRRYSLVQMTMNEGS